ncbi:hypothetical protein [Paenibacillus polymyxa]|uniref:hypothetical protein n=1 Tax=Paenibacillus polymyxa TaxID=1406 RepID=UPI0007EB286E|nr:hypothetical protein [Paenibacillus polymyxa]OAZ49067.1 hypothetical protein A9Z39_13220 [Paenibacillus polymyxa]
MPEECSFKECNDFIKNVQQINQIIIDDTKSFESNIHKWFTQITFEQYKEIKKFFKDIGVDLDLISWFQIDGEGSTEVTEEKFKQKQEEIKKGSISKISRDESLKLIQNLVSSDVLDAYKFCISSKVESCKDDIDVVPELKTPHFGINYRTDRNGKFISLVIWYVPFNSEDLWPIVDDFFFTSDSLNCINGKLKKGDVISSEHTIIFERIDPQEALVNLKTNKGLISVSLEKENAPQIIIKRFKVKYKLKDPYNNPFQFEGETIESQLPKGYKILSAFPTTYNDTIDFPWARVLGNYPTSDNNWIISTNPLRGSVSVYIYAIYDPTDQWEIKLFKNTVKNIEQAYCEIEHGFLLTGGGVEVSIKSYNKKKIYNIGIKEFYPKDNKTWGTSIICSNADFEWDLTVYAIGIKKKDGIEGYVINKNNFLWAWELNDPALTPIGGGMQLDVPEGQVGGVTAIGPLDDLNPDQPTPGLGFDWEPQILNGQRNDWKSKKYMLALKHTDNDIKVIDGIEEINI